MKEMGVRSFYSTDSFDLDISYPFVPLGSAFPFFVQLDPAAAQWIDRSSEPRRSEILPSGVG